MFKKAFRQRRCSPAARSALFFKFILAILCKKVKLLHAKCTHAGKYSWKFAAFWLNCRNMQPLDRPFFFPLS